MLSVWCRYLRSATSRKFLIKKKQSYDHFLIYLYPFPHSYVLILVYLQPKIYVIQKLWKQPICILPSMWCLKYFLDWYQPKQFGLFFSHPLPQHTEHSRRKTAQRQTLGTTVRKWVEYCHGSVSVQLFSILCIVCRLSRWPRYRFFPPREMANCRTETVTADMPLCQRRRRTWRCSGGEGSAVALSSIIKLHGRWTLWKKLLIIYRAVHLSFLSVPSHPSFDLFFCLSIPSLSAGTSWTSSWKLREPTWRSCSVYYRCLFTPQNVYSRLPFTCA